jgi:ketosteroid isomerase-like protein
MTPATQRYPARLLLPALLALLALTSPLYAQQPDPPSAPTDNVKLFQQVEDKWSIAYAHKDQEGMELLLAPTFINVSAAGAVSTRNEVVAQMFDHSTGDLLSIEQRVVNVRTLGDVTLVEGTYITHYKADGHAYDERGIFTHVYQRARTNWICVSAQRTAVYDKSDQSEEKAKKAGKPSNAALPMHIPLIYKGATPSPGATTPPNPSQ